MRNYFALIDEADGSFGVSFPDLPGCVAMADTLDGAADAAREALALFLDELVSDGSEIPLARSFATLRATKDVRSALKDGAVAILVSLPFEPEERERINVMFSKNLLAEVDAAVQEVGITRSSFLERAAFEKLHKPAGDGGVQRLRNFQEGKIGYEAMPYKDKKRIEGKDPKIGRNAETGQFDVRPTNKPRFPRKIKYSK